MGFFGGPTDRVGDSFDFFARPLSKLCVSDAHLRVREKHGCSLSVMLRSQNKTEITPLFGEKFTKKACWDGICTVGWCPGVVGLAGDRKFATKSELTIGVCI